MQPTRCLGKRRYWRHLARWIRRREVAEQTRLLKPGVAIFANLHREQSLMDDLPEPIHDSRPIEVDAGRVLVLERVEGCTLAENVEGLCIGMAANRLEQW